MKFIFILFTVYLTQLSQTLGHENHPPQELKCFTQSICLDKLVECVAGSVSKNNRVTATGKLRLKETKICFFSNGTERVFQVLAPTVIINPNRFNNPKGQALRECRSKLKAAALGYDRCS